jgi:hypothetical protein
VTAPYASWRIFSIPLIWRSIRSSESFSGATWPLIWLFATSRNEELVCWSASDESARNASRASATTAARSSPARRSSMSSVSSWAERLRVTSQAQPAPSARPRMSARMTMADER